MPYTGYDSRGILAVHPQLTREELDELDDLRRMVLEVIEPEPTSYTTT
jgi:hypothetical protein